MKTIKTLITMSGLSAVACTFSCASASSSVEKGWVITQLHEINGKEITYIAKSFVRLDRVSNDYSVIINEKSGLIHFFSDKKKLLYKADIKGFNFKSVNLLRMFTGDSRAGNSWKQLGATKIGNADAICFESADFSNVFRGAKEGGYLAGEKSKVETVTTFYVSKDIAISKEVSRLLSQLQGTKDLGKVPLKEVTTWNDTHKTKTNLDLQEFKRLNIDLSKGRVPTGYRETRNVSDITNRDKSPAEDLLCK